MPGATTRSGLRGRPIRDFSALEPALTSLRVLLGSVHNLARQTLVKEPQDSRLPSAAMFTGSNWWSHQGCAARHLFFRSRWLFR